MAYKFTFDLTKIPKKLFDEIEITVNNGLKKKDITSISKNLVKKFSIDALTGLNSAEARNLIEDIIEIQKNNQLLKKHFHKGNDKALFLPHCCRKYMDSNCKAIFQPETSSYTCAHCSKDCMVSQATNYAKQVGYDVYVLPGGSCVSKIFEKHTYDAVVGIACTDEIKLAAKSLLKLRIPSQAIPLLKNGCSFTSFSIDMLISIIATS
jgi:hypothetical protein